MSDPVYNCLYCNKLLTIKHVIGHMIRSHKDELAVAKNALSFTVGINRKIPVTFKIKIDGEEEVVRACFGCLKCWKRKSLSDAHITECKNKDAHVEVCKSLIPETHQLNSMLQQDNAGSEEITKLKEMIENLMIKNEKLEQQLKKTKKELDELEEENEQSSQKLCDVSMAIATIISPSLRSKIAEYCNTHIRRRTEDDEYGNEDYDFSHDILMTDSSYDYKHENYMKQK